jgi:hypothetical protein
MTVYGSSIGRIAAVEFIKRELSAYQCKSLPMNFRVADFGMINITIFYRLQLIIQEPLSKKTGYPLEIGAG